MKLHSATVLDRTLSCDDRRLVQGTANADAIAIAFDDEWDGLDIRVIFTSTTGEQFMPAAREDGAYVVPSEVTARVGQVYVTAIGTRDSVVVANALMRKPLLVEPRVMADTAPAPSGPVPERVREGLGKLQGHAGQHRLLARRRRAWIRYL